MDQQERAERSRRVVLLTAGIVAAMMAFSIFVFFSYYLDWDWTGLPPRSNVSPDKQLPKTLWDWLDLLIVPVVLAIGGYLFTRSENRATQAAAERRGQDEALQAYLDGMSQLLTDNELSLRDAKPTETLSAVARARTLTVLSRLDGVRKGSVVRFLYEAGLITRDKSVFTLLGADLRKAQLSEARLIEIALSSAELIGADLSYTQLNGADLRGTKLQVADLRWSKLNGADLGIVPLNTDDLGAAVLSGQHGGSYVLIRADLNGANLNYADLTGATGWDEEQLRKVGSLIGATMPDGQALRGDRTPNGPTLEDWLKDRKRSKEDGENEQGPPRRM